MASVWFFLSGLFLANSIPHFVHGISGEAFHNPFLHRFTPWIPSPLFNVLWGLANLGLAGFWFSRRDRNHPFPSTGGIAFFAGFVFAAIGLSLYFHG